MQRLVKRGVGIRPPEKNAKKGDENFPRGGKKKEKEKKTSDLEKGGESNKEGGGVGGVFLVKN